MDNNTENTLHDSQEQTIELPQETPIEPIEAPTPKPYYYQAPEVNLVLAGTGLRFANYIIDLIVFYVALIIGGGVFLGLVFPSALENLETIDPLLDRIATLLLYGIYMGIVEVMTQGRSIGKFITGTKAVNYDGTNISAATAFARGLSRAVPFNQISAFGDPPNPWHDRWNNTNVVIIKSSTLP
jgi:uncharacterized RDD family membrane protein YckC